MKNFIFTLIILALALPGKATTLSDKAEISVLTCSPGKELYSLFGHTAIRVHDPEQDLEVVFNYGTFDFDTPHFYLKFAQGLLPYQLSTSHFQSFMYSYMMEERSVYSQRLQLDSLQRQKLFDLLLGTWSHLMADNLWNTRVNEFLDAHGGKPSEEFRIKKQDDFDLFGKALPIDSLPRVTPRLVAAAAAFPQYPIEEAEVRSTIGVAHEIVRTNHGDRHPTYRLLTEEFFAQVFTESVALPDRLFTERLG